MSNLDDLIKEHKKIVEKAVEIVGEDYRKFVISSWNYVYHIALEHTGDIEFSMYNANEHMKSNYLIGDM